MKRRCSRVAVARRSSLASARVAVSAAARGRGVCIDEQGRRRRSSACGGNGPKDVRTSGGAQTARQDAAGQLPLGAAARGSEEARPADEADQPDRVDGRCAARRAQEPPRSARQRALLVTEIQGLESLFETTPKNAPDRPQLGAAPRRGATSSSSPPPSATRREAEIKRDEAKKTNPQAAGQQQTAGEPGRPGHGGRAQEGDQELHAASTNDYPNYAAARRGPLLPRVRVRAGERPQERAQGLLRAHPEGARTRSTSRTRTSRSASSSSTKRRAIPRSGTSPRRRTTRSSSTRRRTTRSTATPVQARATSSGTRASFDKALNEFKKTIEFGVSSRQLPERREARRLRASRRHPGLRPQGRPGAGLQLLAQPSRATRPATNEKTFKMMDDLGQNYLDTGHYPEAIALYKDLIGRDKRRRASASTRRTSPKRRWR